MARPVVEFAHVEGARLVVDEVGPLLQDLHDIFLHHVGVPDLIPGQKGSGLTLRGHIRKQTHGYSLHTLTMEYNICKVIIGYFDLHMKEVYVYSLVYLLDPR